jgi:hypothetical protein
MSFGMTGFWYVLGEGSRGDSIVILSENKIPVNRLCFLPPLSYLKIGVIPKFSTKKVNYLT